MLRAAFLILLLLSGAGLASAGTGGSHPSVWVRMISWLGFEDNSLTAPETDLPKIHISNISVQKANYFELEAAKNSGYPKVVIGDGKTCYKVMNKRTFPRVHINLNNCSSWKEVWI